MVKATRYAGVLFAEMMGARKISREINSLIFVHITYQRRKHAENL